MEKQGPNYIPDNEAFGEMRQKYLEQKREQQRQKAWYQPMTIVSLISLLLMLIPILTPFVNREKVELGYAYTDVQPLTNFSADVQDDVQVFFRDKPANNIGKINVKIKNTGRKELKSDDFPDGPIRFDIKRSNYFEYGTDSLGGNTPFLLDVVLRNNSGQKSDKISPLISIGANAHFTYMPSLLNSNETVDLEIYVSETEGVTTDISGKVANGKIIPLPADIKSQYENYGTFKRLGYSIAALIGDKAWWALLLLFILLAWSAVMLIETIIESMPVEYTMEGIHIVGAAVITAFILFLLISVCTTL